MSYLPIGVHVLNPSAPAAFAAGATGLVEIVGAEFVPVPDVTSNFTLFVLGLMSLLATKRAGKRKGKEDMW